MIPEKIIKRLDLPFWRQARIVVSDHKGDNSLFEFPFSYETLEMSLLFFKDRSKVYFYFDTTWCSFPVVGVQGEGDEVWAFLARLLLSVADYLRNTLPQTKHGLDGLVFLVPALNYELNKVSPFNNQTCIAGPFTFNNNTQERSGSPNYRRYEWSDWLSTYFVDLTGYKIFDSLTKDRELNVPENTLERGHYKKLMAMTYHYPFYIDDYSDEYELPIKRNDRAEKQILSVLFAIIKSLQFDQVYDKWETCWGSFKDKNDKYTNEIVKKCRIYYLVCLYCLYRDGESQKDPLGFKIQVERGECLDDNVQVGLFYLRRILCIDFELPVAYYETCLKDVFEHVHGFYQLVAEVLKSNNEIVLSSEFMGFELGLNHEENPKFLDTVIRNSNFILMMLVYGSNGDADRTKYNDIDLMRQVIRISNLLDTSPVKLYRSRCLLLGLGYLPHSVRLKLLTRSEEEEEKYRVYHYRAVANPSEIIGYSEIAKHNGIGNNESLTLGLPVEVVQKDDPDLVARAKTWQMIETNDQIGMVTPQKREEKSNIDNEHASFVGTSSRSYDNQTGQDVSGGVPVLEGKGTDDETTGNNNDEPLVDFLGPEQLSGSTETGSFLRTEETTDDDTPSAKLGSGKQDNFVSLLEDSFTQAYKHGQNKVITMPVPYDQNELEAIQKKFVELVHRSYMGLESPSAAQGVYQTFPVGFNYVVSEDTVVNYLFAETDVNKDNRLVCVKYKQIQDDNEQSGYIKKLVDLESTARFLYVLTYSLCSWLNMKYSKKKCNAVFIDEDNRLSSGKEKIKIVDPASVYFIIKSVRVGSEDIRLSLCVLMKDDVRSHTNKYKLFNVYEEGFFGFALDDEQSVQQKQEEMINSVFEDVISILHENSCFVSLSPMTVAENNRRQTRPSNILSMFLFNLFAVFEVLAGKWSSKEDSFLGIIDLQSISDSVFISGFYKKQKDIPSCVSGIISDIEEAKSISSIEKLGYSTKVYTGSDNTAPVCRFEEDENGRTVPVVFNIPSSITERLYTFPFSEYTNLGKPLSPPLDFSIVSWMCERFYSIVQCDNNCVLLYPIDVFLNKGKMGSIPFYCDGFGPDYRTRLVKKQVDRLKFEGYQTIHEGIRYMLFPFYEGSGETGHYFLYVVELIITKKDDNNEPILKAVVNIVDSRLKEGLTVSKQDHRGFIRCLRGLIKDTWCTEVNTQYIVEEGKTMHAVYLKQTDQDYGFNTALNVFYHTCCCNNVNLVSLMSLKETALSDLRRLIDTSGKKG